ncbi:MAG TPA: outer membrane protein transport protein [Polyangia bacterium]
MISLWRRLLNLTIAVALASWPLAAHGYPLLAPRPVPDAIAGPTDPDVAAVFYNPAALGPLRGLHLRLDGGARLYEGSIDRNAGGAGSSTPINWADPISFAGVSWDLDTDSFTVGLAVYTPFSDLTSYGDAPVRYHAIGTTSMVFEQAAAAAFRVSGRFYVGASANFAEEWLDYTYARDAAIYGGSAGVAQPGGLCGAQPCGYENPLAAQTLRLRGFGWGVGFSVGVLARPIDRLWLGLSYTSHIFNPGQGGDFPLGDTLRPRVKPAPGEGAVCPDLSPSSSNTCRAGDRVTTYIPDILQLGVRIEVDPKVDIEGQARWVHYGERPNLDVALQGGDLANLAHSTATAIPPELLLDRGLTDAWGFEVSGRWKLGRSLRLSPSLFFETSAVESGAVNAASIDAPKLDLTLTAEWHPVKHLMLGAHVGATGYILGEAGQSFDPKAEVACVDAGYALSACGAANRGDGLPSAAGRYTLFVVHVGGAIGVDY